MKMYVECCKSKDKDSTYQVLMIDVGYRKMKLFELGKDIIAELADVKISELYSMKEGETITIGEIIRKQVKWYG